MQRPVRTPERWFCFQQQQHRQLGALNQHSADMAFCRLAAPKHPGTSFDLSHPICFRLLTGVCVDSGWFTSCRICGVDECHVCADAIGCVRFAVNRWHRIAALWLQVLFVDRTDTIRARLACGIFEVCSLLAKCMQLPRSRTSKMAGTQQQLISFVLISKRNIALHTTPHGDTCSSNQHGVLLHGCHVRLAKLQLPSQVHVHVVYPAQQLEGTSLLLLLMGITWKLTVLTLVHSVALVAPCSVWLNGMALVECCVYGPAEWKLPQLTA